MAASSGHLNIVIDVQDSVHEMSPQARAHFMRSFESNIQHFDPASQQFFRTRLATLPTAQELEVARAYRQQIRGAVDELRARGIPTLWMSIGDETRLYPAQQPWSRRAAPVRAAEELGLLQLAGVGPRRDEDVLLKRFMSGFVTPEEIRASPVLERAISRQRADGALWAQAAFDSPSLLSHLQGQGVRHVSIMGGMTQYCIADNALGAAMRGLKVTVCSDMVRAERGYAPSPDHNATETEKLRQSLTDIVQNPTSRGYEAAAAPKLAAAARAIEVKPLAEHLASLGQSTPAAGLKGRGPLLAFGILATGAVALYNGLKASELPDSQKTPKTQAKPAAVDVKPSL